MKYFYWAFAIYISGSLSACKPRDDSLLSEGLSQGADPFEIPGQNLPPEDTGSLLDEIFFNTKQNAYVVPKDFDSFLAKVAEHLGEPVGVLVPYGRSPESRLAYPNIFEHPRFLVGFGNRFFAGFSEVDGVIQVISLNDSFARYEFQLIKDGEIFYADRANCTACHQSGSTIFSVRPWSEVGSNDIRTGGDDQRNLSLYRKVLEKRNGQLPKAIKNFSAIDFDEKVGFSNDLRLPQALWSGYCGQQDSVLCRRSLIEEGVIQATRYNPLSGNIMWKTEHSFVAAHKDRINEYVDKNLTAKMFDSVLTDFNPFGDRFTLTNVANKVTGEHSPLTKRKFVAVRSSQAMFLSRKVADKIDNENRQKFFAFYLTDKVSSSDGMIAYKFSRRGSSKIHCPEKITKPTPCRFEKGDDTKDSFDIVLAGRNFAGYIPVSTSTQEGGSKQYSICRMGSLGLECGIYPQDFEVHAAYKESPLMGLFAEIKANTERYFKRIEYLATNTNLLTSPYFQRERISKIIAEGPNKKLLRETAYPDNDMKKLVPQDSGLAIEHSTIPAISILIDKCGSCHVSKSKPAFLKKSAVPLQGILQHKKSIISQIKTNVMPPSEPLSEEEKSLVIKWLNR